MRNVNGLYRYGTLPLLSSWFVGLGGAAQPKTRPCRLSARPGHYKKQTGEFDDICSMVVYNNGPMAIHMTVIERPGSGCLPDGAMNTLVHVYINCYKLSMITSSFITCVFKLFMVIVWWQNYKKIMEKWCLQFWTFANVVRCELELLLNVTFFKCQYLEKNES